jgi:hypothetical protein
MTIYDQSGNVVATLTVLNGETQSLTVFLAPGTYTVRLAGGTRDGSPLPPTSYLLLGLNLSDPIGPQPVNSTLAPSTSSTQPDMSYFWLQYGYVSFLALTDPSGDPVFGS